MLHPFRRTPRTPAETPTEGRPRRTRLFVALNLAVLLVLAGGTAAYGVLAKTVTLDVDGHTETVRTFGGSVDALLASRDVEVGQEDALNLEPAEKVSDGDTITVRYAKDVTVVVDGESADDTVHAATVAEALEQLEVQPHSEAFLSEDPDTRLGRDGGQIVVSNPKDVTVVADGEKTTVTTALPTAEEVLQEAGVELADADRLDVGLGSYVEQDQKLTVTRVEMVDKTETIETDVPVETRDDDTMDKGETEVLEEGSPGEIREQVLLTLEDGKVVNRLVLTSETVREATPRVEARGTKEAPSAPTVPNGSVWDRIAQCESGGNWSINTGNGYYGGLQFNPNTWRSVGGPGLPHQHSREVQIKYAEILQKRSGWGQWSCAAKVGVG